MIRHFLIFYPKLGCKTVHVCIGLLEYNIDIYRSRTAEKMKNRIDRIEQHNI